MLECARAAPQNSIFVRQHMHGIMDLNGGGNMATDGQPREPDCEPIVYFDGFEDGILRNRSKSGKFQEIVHNDKVLARIIRRCQDLPGQRRFEYVQPDGKVQPISLDDVNNYLREITTQDFTSKDFRTWKGSVLALSILSDMGTPTSRPWLTRTSCRR
jgi:hypothetical protein